MSEVGMVSDVLTPLPSVEVELADAWERQRKSWRVPRSTALLLALVLLVAGFVGGVYTAKQLLAPAARPAATTPQQGGFQGGGFPGGGGFQGGQRPGGGG